MDYGYCLTAHKAQGAEWDDVLVLEEVSRSWDARRWRYTAATRAKQRLVYCR
jgi:exodeoxyribonuclease-5